MKKKYILLILFICNLSNLNAQKLLSTRDINFYLKQNDSLLWKYYQQVKIQSKMQNYPIYRGRKIITQQEYENLLADQKKDLFGQIVLVSLFLRDQILYSNLGGITIQGVLAEEVQDRRAKTYFYKFDGHYYEDFKALDKTHRVYAYCILPSFSQCLLLGIHEEWK